MRVWLLRALALAVALLAVQGAAAAKDTTPSVVVNNGQLSVKGQPYSIKAIAYSPVPVGETVEQLPHGDYFTPDYAYIWARDLPAIAAAGFNTLRLYSWDNTVDHSPFLDACEQFGLKVILTYYVDPLEGASVWDTAAQQQVINGYVSSVGLLGDHPAILMWSFGNELNGPWNGFLAKFDDNPVEDDTTTGSCGWQTSNNGGSCYNIQAGDPAEGTACFTATNCLYRRFYGWLNRALSAAKAQTTRPMTSTFADVDYLVTGAATDRLKRFDSLLPDMDVIAVQLYRGRSFGAYFDQFAAVTSKPLLVGEYGVDAMNDPCGWPGATSPCYNYYGEPNMKGGSSADEFKTGCGNGGNCDLPGEQPQADWDAGLTKEILAAAPKHVLGGVLIGWHDENWKNFDTEDFCETPCGATAQDLQSSTDKIATELEAQAKCVAPGTLRDSFQAEGACTDKAHVHCRMHDAFYHGLCGYNLDSAPDGYVNEAWFGVNAVTDCGNSFTDQYGGHRLSALAPRPVIAQMTSIFSGAGGSAAQAQSCSAMAACYNCVKAAWNIDTHTAPDVVSGKCNAACGLNLGGDGGSGTGGDNNNGSTGTDGGSDNGSSGTDGGNTDGSSTGSNGGGSNNGGGNGNVDNPSAASAHASSMLLLAALAFAALLI